MIDPRPERMGRRALIAGAGATAALVSGRRASAALPSEAGILVGAFLGSPYDIHARILVRHLHRLYPAIRAQVETMPRAGGKLAAKLVYDSAGDGRTLAMLPSGLIFAELLGEEGVAGAAADPPMMKLLDSHFRIGRALCLGPRTPEALVQTWRGAPDAVMHDEIYRREIAGAGLVLNPLPGTELQSLVAGVFDSSGEIRDALQAALACGMKIADLGSSGC